MIRKLCDRCGVAISESGMMHSGSVDFDCNGYGSLRNIYRCYNLCPKCFQEFEVWIKRKEEKKWKENGSP